MTTDSPDLRNRNFAQLAALSTVVGTMLGVMRAKGSLTQAEIELIFSAAQAAAPDDAAGEQLIATVKALMIEVGDQPYRRPVASEAAKSADKVTRIGAGALAERAPAAEPARPSLGRGLVGSTG
jgi:hypothetical protein